MNQQYLFTSGRLGFRNWIDTDIPKMQLISSDPDVMEFFPALATHEQTSLFIRRMQEMFHQNRYCYFAIDRLDNGNFIGFIGLCYQDYESAFTPCVDIGWRLDKNQWGRGFATEGAKRCLQYAFNDLHLNNIKSTAPKINIKSVNVMEKIGMKKLMEFNHPKMMHHERLKEFVCYEINR